MAWTVSYYYQKIKVWFDSSGVIGFDLKKDPEAIEAINNNDPAILEALRVALGEYPEIAAVHNMLDWTFKYYVGDRLRYADEGELESMEKDLRAFIDSKYSSDSHKAEARAWLTQVVDKIASKRRIRAKKEKAAATDRGGYIYLIKAETGHYKIGRTKSIPDRLNFFGVKLPFAIELLKTIPVDDMYYFESWLHQYFSEHRVNGEWFNLDDISVENIIGFEDQADLEDYISFMTHP